MEKMVGNAKEAIIFVTGYLCMTAIAALSILIINNVGSPHIHPKGIELPKRRGSRKRRAVTTVGTAPPEPSHHTEMPTSAPMRLPT
jgi:hypothetical protein